MSNSDLFKDPSDSPAMQALQQASTLSRGVLAKRMSERPPISEKTARILRFRRQYENILHTFLRAGWIDDKLQVIGQEDVHFPTFSGIEEGELGKEMRADSPQNERRLIMVPESSHGNQETWLGLLSILQEMGVPTTIDTWFDVKKPKSKIIAGWRVYLGNIFTSSTEPNQKKGSTLSLRKARKQLEDEASSLLPVNRVHWTAALIAALGEGGKVGEAETFFDAESSEAYSLPAGAWWHDCAIFSKVSFNTKGLAHNFASVKGGKTLFK